MDEIISLASDEEDCKSPPRKRIKPMLLTNLPNVSITKIPKKKCKKQEIVYIDVSSSEDDSDSENKKETEEKANKCKPVNNRKGSILKSVLGDCSVALVDCINGKATEDRNLDKNVGNNDVIQIVDDGEDISEVNNIASESIEVLDIDNESVGNGELTERLEDSCEIINADSEEETSSREKKIDDISDIDQPQPGSSKPDKPPNTILFGKFLKLIEEQTQDDKYTVVKQKFPLLLNYYSKCEETLGDSNNFKTLLLSSTKIAEKTAALAVKGFHDVYQHLKEHVNSDSIEVEIHHVPQIRKLEKAIKQLIKMIKHLEEQELDFDQEEDSSYIKLERYISRLDKLYKKYCGLIKKNPHNGRLTYSKLDFVNSEYNEINRAISKKYNNRKFPSYYEMEKFIEKVVKDNNLELDEETIKKESIHCFKRLGELLQNRRQKELYDSHIMLLKDTEDPAKEDPALSTVLKNNYVEGQEKLQILVEGYVSKQENKSENVSTSSEDDSDKSNYVDSEGDQEDENKGDT